MCCWRIPAAFFAMYSLYSGPNSYWIPLCLDKVAASCFIKSCKAFSSFSESYCSRCLEKDSIHTPLYCLKKPSASSWLYFIGAKFILRCDNETMRICSKNMFQKMRPIKDLFIKTKALLGQEKKGREREGGERKKGEGEWDIHRKAEVNKDNFRIYGITQNLHETNKWDAFSKLFSQQLIL